MNRGLLIFALLLATTSANACAQCAWGLMWSVFPPAVWWVGILLFWFLVLGLIGFFAEERLPGIPGAGMTLLIAIVAILLGATFPAGPLFTVAVCICTAVAAVKIALALRRRSTAYAHHSALRKAFFISAVIAVPALIVSGVYTTIQALNMDKADKIIMWAGTVVSRRWERQLQDGQPETLQQNRKILKQPQHYESGEAAVRLAKYSKSKDDALLILDALAATQKDLYGPQQDYRAALQRMTGLDLPSTASAAVWQKELANLPAQLR